MSDGTEQLGLIEAVPEAVESSKWSIPFAVGLDKLDLITKACYQLHADTEPVEGNKIASATNIHPKTTTPNLAFLVAIGVLTQDKSKTTYQLTPKGKQYAASLKSNEMKEASNALKALLQNSHLKDLLDYVELHSGSNDLTYENLFAKIKSLARIKEDSSGSVNNTYRAGINCLMGLLARADFVTQDVIQKPEGVRASTSTPKRQVRTQKEAATGERTPDTRDEGRTSPPSNQPTFASLPMNINVVIEAKDSESIKQVIELVKAVHGLNSGAKISLNASQVSSQEPTT